MRRIKASPDKICFNALSAAFTERALIVYIKEPQNSKGLVRLPQILLEATDLGCISGVRHSRKVLNRQAEGLGTNETSHLDEPLLTGKDRER